MARNRKSQSAAIRFGPALKAFLFCLLIGGSGVGYVWQKDQIGRLGRQIKEREMRVLALQQQNEKLSVQRAIMCSPQALKQRIKDLNLGLVDRQPGQTWTLMEPQAERPDVERQFAARNENTTRPR
jgi:hypothetical protein